MSFHSRRASLLALVGAACRLDSWVGKIPWRRERLPTSVFLGFPGGSAGRESPCNEGDLDLIPGLGRSPGEWNGYLLQYSCLENPMDRGAWKATVHRVNTELDMTEVTQQQQQQLFSW